MVDEVEKYKIAYFLQFKRRFAATSHQSLRDSFSSRRSLLYFFYTQKRTLFHRVRFVLSIKPRTEKSVNIKINIAGQVALLLPTEAQASAKYTVNRRSFSELLRFFLLRHRRFTVSVYACKRRFLISVTFSTVCIVEKFFIDTV